MKVMKGEFYENLVVDKLPKEKLPKCAQLPDPHHYMD